MAPRKKSGKRGSTKPGPSDDAKGKKRKGNSGGNTGPALVAQPHGGALLTGGVPGHVGGPGRPRSVIRKGLLVDFDERTKFYRAVIDGDLVERREVSLAAVLPHVKCSLEGCSGKIIPKDIADLFIVKFSAKASASVGDRLKAMEAAGKFSLGVVKGIDTDEVEENVKLTRDIIRELCTPDQFTAIDKRMRAVWAG